MSFPAVLRVRRLLPILALLLAARGAMAQPLVAPTEPVSPAEQQQKFKLPPGFEIELVAAEPDIHKPMNLEFDDRGRLWVTHSIEYPFAAASDEAAARRDHHFSGADAGSRPETPIRFAEHLNIPIGLLPLTIGGRWPGHNIPNILPADATATATAGPTSASVLYGIFGISDTHGMTNALHLGIRRLDLRLSRLPNDLDSQGQRPSADR